MQDLISTRERKDTLNKIFPCVLLFLLLLEIVMLNYFVNLFAFNEMFNLKNKEIVTKYRISQGKIIKIGNCLHSCFKNL